MYHFNSYINNYLYIINGFDEKKMKWKKIKK